MHLLPFVLLPLLTYAARFGSQGANTADTQFTAKPADSGWKDPATVKPWTAPSISIPQLTKTYGWGTPKDTPPPAPAAPSVPTSVPSPSLQSPPPAQSPWTPPAQAPSQAPAPAPAPAASSSDAPAVAPAAPAPAQTWTSTPDYNSPAAPSPAAPSPAAPVAPASDSPAPAAPAQSTFAAQAPAESSPASAPSIGGSPFLPGGDGSVPSLASSIPSSPITSLPPGAIPVLSSFLSMTTTAPFVPLSVPSSPPLSGDSLPGGMCQDGTGGVAGGQWVPFLPVQAGACPSGITNQTWLMDANQSGCCPSNAYIASPRIGQGPACCPCGSTCGGLAPGPGQPWSVASGTLSINGQPYTMSIGPPSPSGAAGVFTIPGAVPIPIDFVPVSSFVECGAGLCETIYYGPSTQLTMIGPAENIIVTTTATAVMFGTALGYAMPTETVYAVQTIVAPFGNAAPAQATGLIKAGLAAVIVAGVMI